MKPNKEKENRPDVAPSSPGNGYGDSGAFTSGYILLYRLLLDNPLWNQLPAEWLKIWIGILLRANFRPTKWWDGTKQVDVPAGAFITSIEKLADFCKVTPKQIRGSLSYLERAGMVARHRAGVYTLLVVQNWATYQPLLASEGTAEGIAEGKVGAYTRADRGQTEGRPRATEEEGNELISNTPGSLFDAETTSDTPSVVRPTVRSTKKKPSTSMSPEQRERFRQFLELHPKNTVQTVAAEKLWAEKVTDEAVASWLIAQLRREIVGDTTYMFGPWKWLADHLALYANGLSGNPPKAGAPQQSFKTTMDPDTARRIAEARREAPIGSA